MASYSSLPARGLEQTSADKDLRADRSRVDRGVETGGLKEDSGKPPLDLIDVGFQIDLARVLGYGAKKYAPHNWRKGLALSRLLAATLRHVLAFLGGEDDDLETGLSHLSHASCELMFAHWMIKNRPDLDDRFKRFKKAKTT